MAKVQKWCITKKVTTDAKKSEIKDWERDEMLNDNITIWTVKNLTIEKCESDCC